MKRWILFAGLLLLPLYASAQTTTAYGITFPNAHPRLFWNSTRLTAAQSWVTSTGYTGVTTWNDPFQGEDLAFTCFVGSGMGGTIGTNASTACALIASAAPAANVTCSTGAGCDTMREYGEENFMMLDWFYPGCGKASCISAGGITTMITNWNTWMTNQDAPGQTWGNIGMPAINYFSGQFRNDFDFGIASYIDNASADSFLAYGANKTAAANTRWNDLLNCSQQSGDNGIDSGNATKCYALGTLEGAEYGRYDANYYAFALTAAKFDNRDMWTESPAFQGDVLALIYNTSAQKMTNSSAYGLMTWADDEDWAIAADTPDNANPQSRYWDTYMNAAAQEYSAVAIGKLARTYLSNVGTSTVAPIFASIDPGGSSQAFSTLPLDYFASGPQFMWARDSWATTGTQVLFQLGSTRVGGGFSHAHDDAGTFQIYRKGAFLARETPGYQDSVAGYNDVSTAGTYSGFSHSIPVIGGQAMQGSAPTFGECHDGNGVMKALETQTGYAYADVDLTLNYQNNVCDPGQPGRENGNVVHVERGEWYFRGIDVLVILDRFQTTASSTSTTFMSHCEVPWTLSSPTAICIDTGQEAKYFALVPATPSMVSVNETDNSANCAVSFMTACQYRLESNNANPGNVVSYSLYAIQIGDSSGFSSLSPSVTDSNPGSPTSGTFTVTLNGSNSLVLNKGTTSSGGTITAAGVTNALATIPEIMTVTNAGPVWGSANVSPSGVHFGLLPFFPTEELP